jgi:uncharacterized membrane protein/glutaredoxin
MEKVQRMVFIRRKIVTILLLSTMLISLAVSVAELTGKTSLICSDSSCLRVQTSSFSRVINVPIGFYAFILLGCCLYFHLRKEEKTLFLLLSTVMGLELYLTFLEFFFIHSVCKVCLVFFSLVVSTLTFVWLDLEKSWKELKVGLFCGVLFFLGAHFIFFFPHVELNPTVLREDPAPARVEVFASPSCPHCEEALKALKEICSSLDAELVVRPVCLTEADRKKALDWVCGYLFQCSSGTSRRLAEKVIWENEREALNLTGGRLAVPLIVVRCEDGEKIFKGWSQEVRNRLESLIIESSGSFFSGFLPDRAEAGVCGGEMCRGSDG